MAKKRQPDRPAKLPRFSTTPFSSLKGVVAAPALPATPPSAKPSASEVLQAPHKEDDDTLFLQAMDDVKKLGDTRQIAGKDSVASRKRHASTAETTPGALPPHPDSASTKLFLQEIGRLKLEVKFTESLPDEDELKPLSGNRIKQLKRGIVSVDYQLDLHGLTRDEALIEMPRFLRTAQMRGQTAVLVITGKGYNSTAEPVLQQAVAAWLRDAGRELVVEFAPAPREMGGSGAYVVFLRPLPKSASAPS
jgi:DNA-nicking Smr family endonuclease